MTKVLLMILLFNIMTFSLGQITQLRTSGSRRETRMSREYSPRRARFFDPTCEELKNMWRFSRRQSKMAELTNEAPMYKDPFAYNVWQKYAKTGSPVLSPRPMGRIRSQPIYGRVVNTAPSDYPRVMSPERPKYYGVVRYYEPTQEEEESRNFGLAATFGYPNRRRKGSFELLKELVYADRMKDLHKQRAADLARPRLILPDGVNRSPAMASPPRLGSAPVPVPGSSPAPVQTPPPPPSPAPGGIHASMKDFLVPMARPYEPPFRGRESSDYISPYYQSKVSKMKLTSDYLNRRNNQNGGEKDEENNEKMRNDDPVYGTPYRSKQMFVDDEPFFDY